MYDLLATNDAVIGVIIGLAVSIALPFITKAAKGAGAAGSKDKLSVDQAVNFVNGYQEQLKQAEKEQAMKDFMNNPQSLLYIGIAAVFAFLLIFKTNKKR